MKPSEFIKVEIHVTSYKKDNLTTDLTKMNEDKNMRSSKLNHKFICSICLKSKPEDTTDEHYKINSKPCPICQKGRDFCKENVQSEAEKMHYKTEKEQKTKVSNKDKDRPKSMNTETKSVQTVQTDLNLLNEVLTVFQSKKTEQVKSKTVLLKDASVSTNNVRYLYAKLSVSKVFQFSIDHNKANENGKFIVMSSKGDDCRSSNIDLIITHKSSSIPQMKLEELKYCLKEKTKSKDAIEEVNRMFATVKRNYKNNDNLNRPSIRSGPRLLPVVETNADHNAKHLLSCKCCQTYNCMSSGDPIKCYQPKENERSVQTKCCHTKESEKCVKCVYMLCCHYKNCRQMQAGVMICEKCQDVKQFPWKHSKHSIEDSG